jgi:hypothetical protein
MKDSNWDLDYRDGLLGESKIADLLHLDTVEVKTDRRWLQTGNIYIETECFYQTDNEWKPSGIRVSQASHWGFVLEDTILIVPMYRLKEIIWEHGKPITCNIPPNPTRGYLITPGALMEFVRAQRNFEIEAHDEYETHRIYG